MTKSYQKTVSANFDLFWVEDTQTGCWVWTGAISKGYGCLKVKGRGVKAYRFSYELVNGPIPVGAHILHSCDNKKCVNPAHLRVGTHAENMLDRKRSWTPPSGERAANAHLTQDQVDQIRALVSRGMLQREAGRIFGVRQSTVSSICLYKSWPGTEASCSL